MFETLPLHDIQLVPYPVNYIQTHTVMQLEAIKHPAYSLDFLPCHFHIFGPIKKALKDCIFTADRDVQ